MTRKQGSVITQHGFEAGPTFATFLIQPYVFIADESWRRTRYWTDPNDIRFDYGKINFTICKPHFRPTQDSQLTADLLCL